MRFPRLFHIKKARRYPIQRDERGRSLRERCLERFDQQRRPAEVARELGMKEPTAQRYFRQWKQQGFNFERYYSYAKGLFEMTNPDRQRNIELFAAGLRISQEQSEAILFRPYGLRRLLLGKLYFPVQEEVDHELHLVLQVAIIFADHLLKQGGKLEDVELVLWRYLQMEKNDREAEEVNIKKWNQTMVLIHKVLEVAIEKEQQGGILPDTFTEEEFRYGVRDKIRQAQQETTNAYWDRKT